MLQFFTTQVLRDSFGVQTDEEVQAIFHRIQASGRQGRRLLDSFLAATDYKAFISFMVEYSAAAADDEMMMLNDLDRDFRNNDPMKRLRTQAAI